MKRILFALALLAGFMGLEARTLIIYYSYTNNVGRIVNELRSMIEADVVEIQPAEKGLDYAANNYAIGSAQIAAIRQNPDDEASYPEIDPVDINLSLYDCVIIGAPLWWSNMAAPLQTYLFQYGRELAGKQIGLIVSSASSGISGVEADARRLVPEGSFLSPSLWIRSSQTGNARSMLEEWLKAVDYDRLAAIDGPIADTYHPQRYTVYTLSGIKLLSGASSTAGVPAGLYIVNGEKVRID